MKPIDTSVFSPDYLYDISLGRLYISYFKRIFSSEVINNLKVDPDSYIQSLKNEGYLVETLGIFKRTNFEEESDKKTVVWEYIILVNENILMGIMDGSYRICYNQDNPADIIKRMTDLYIESNRKIYN